MENYLFGKNPSDPIRLAHRVVVRAPRSSFPSSGLVDFIDGDSAVLDCGRGTREQYSVLAKRARTIDTLDAFRYDDYPSILFDLSSETLPEELKDRFDVIYCFSILEHVPNPFLAARNLQRMLRTNGRIIGYVPWLFPYHAGRGLGQEGFEDFWRFSPEGLGLLFAEGGSLEVFPTRGRFATALLVMLFSRGRNLWKGLERKLPGWKSATSLLASRGGNRWQASGYEFIFRAGTGTAPN